MPRIKYKIDEQGYGKKPPPMHDPRPKTQVVDKHGRPQVLSARQKNALYHQSKNIQRTMKDGMCTKKQCWDTDERALLRMKGERGMKHEINYMKKAMKAIGADPRDYDPERLRRRR